MPFTFSHPALVLPLSYLPRKYYSLSGLIAGSITPDFEYFIRMNVDSQYSHTLAGMFWFDLPIGVIITFIFHGIVRDPLLSNLPGWFYRRMKIVADFSWKKYFIRNWPVVLVSLLIGIASHLFWDDFTHKTGYFVLRFASLAKEISIGGFRIPVYFLLQHGSTIAGAIVIWFAIKRMPQDRTIFASVNWWYWIFSILIMLLVIAIGKFSGQNYFLYGQLFVTGISGGLIGLIMTSFYWKIKREKGS